MSLLRQPMQEEKAINRLWVQLWTAIVHSVLPADENTLSEDVLISATDRTHLVNILNFGHISPFPARKSECQRYSGSCPLHPALVTSLQRIDSLMTLLLLSFGQWRAYGHVSTIGKFLHVGLITEYSSFHCMGLGVLAWHESTRLLYRLATASAKQ